MSPASANTICLACGSSPAIKTEAAIPSTSGARRSRAWTWFQRLHTRAHGSRFWICSAVELPASAFRSCILEG